METRDSVDADEQVPRHKQHKQYVKPELVRYGALEEITRDYTDSRSCRGAPCING
jgi:hypothetical protein